jgi:ATP-dependent Clp protease ATP-binding subunit ClpA
MPRHFGSSGCAEQLAENPKSILFIGGPRSSAGASGGTLGTSTCSPALSTGAMKCIRRLWRIRQIFEKERAVAHSRKSTCRSPIAETIEILKGLKSRFEQHHGVKYARDAHDGRRAVGAFINDRHLPDKAIDVMTRPAPRRRSCRARSRRKISKTEIEEIVAKIARIPARNVSDDRNALKTPIAT